MSAKHGLEALLVRALAGALGAVPWPGVLGVGAALGALAGSAGMRRRVAEANLLIAFPERSAAERRRILGLHYRELGRVAAEYPRLGSLVRAADGEVVAEIRGREHLESVRDEGRGAILLTGHFGNFELLGAALGRINPVDFVVKPLSNRGVESDIARWRRDAGVGTIPVGVGVRGVFDALRRNRWVAMLADQDARRAGLFVPFFGRPTSTPAGPAAIAIRTGAPIVMGFGTRRPDGRHVLEVLPPLRPGAEQGDRAVRELTARHAAVLERQIREHPAQWFWLHRRWKTAAQSEAESART